MRYYYKSQDENNWLSLKSPLSDSEIAEGNYISISKEEFDQHMEAIKPIPLTPTEEYVKDIQRQIAEIKKELASSDYKAIKYAEGWISEEDYAPIKAERQALRDRINELEALIINK